MAETKFLGASGTVTGSCYVVTADNGSQIMIDCGMFQGPKKISDLNFEAIDVDVSRLSGILLSHAHLDHCGRLPILIKNGYKKTIYATAPTIDLTNLVLLDTAKIAKENRRDKPLYSETDVEYTVSQMKTVEYDKPFSVNDFKITYRDAGHILGSACIEIEVDGKKVIFSADLGNSPEDLLKPTTPISHGNTVIMESTYGDRTHSPEDGQEVLTQEINSIEETGGILLIPSFSIERAQELLHSIDHLKKAGRVLENTQVFLDSPMAIKATKIYSQYKNLYSQELSEHSQTDDPFDFPGLHLTDKPKDSRKILDEPGAKVIIAGSGMLTGGRIVHHLKNFIEQPSTRILFVGFQTEETLGSSLLNGAKNIHISGKKYRVEASIRKSSALSAHADQPKLMTWLSHIQGVSLIFLTHGEDLPREVLAKLISTRLGITNVCLPKLHDVRSLF